MTSFFPFLAIVAGVIFLTKLPLIIQTASAKDLLAADKATQLSNAVRFGGTMFIGVGLVATATYWL